MAARQVAPRALRQPRSGAPAEDRARAEQTADLAPVLSSPMLRARRVGEIKLSLAIIKAIPHGLGVVPQDWFVTSPRTLGLVFEMGRDRDVLRLAADADQTCTLWVIPP